MTNPTIETPRGKIFIGKSGKARLVWDSTFQQKWQGNYSMAQKMVDQAVMDGCEKYTPLLTGMLKLSNILGTTPGEGVVSWIAPYSRYQYYSKRAPGSQSGPLRGPFWFERWKAVSAEKVITGARRIAGKGTK